MVCNRTGSARRARAHFGLALGTLALTLTSVCARAADGDDTFFDSILGGIGVTKKDPGIDYRERSPLVVPPKLNLPPPDAASADQNNANWPVDAAVKPRQKQKEYQTPGVEVKRSTSATTPISVPLDKTGRPEEPGSKNTFGFIDMDGASKLFGIYGQEKGTFTAEPPRTTLVQPPEGYRTPSPNQPYGTGLPKNEAKKNEAKKNEANAAPAGTTATTGTSDKH
jgi:hypothetical protein